MAAVDTLKRGNLQYTRGSTPGTAATPRQPGRKDISRSALMDIGLGAISKGKGYGHQVRYNNKGKGKQKGFYNKGKGSATKEDWATGKERLKHQHQG